MHYILQIKKMLEAIEYASEHQEKLEDRVEIIPQQYQEYETSPTVDECIDAFIYKKKYTKVFAKRILAIGIAEGYIKVIEDPTGRMLTKRPDKLGVTNEGIKFQTVVGFMNALAGSFSKITPILALIISIIAVFISVIALVEAR